MLKISKIFLILLTLILSSCTKKVQNNGSYRNEVDLSTVTIDESKIDLDLTKLSATFVYSEVFNMLVEPDNYNDKTIKIKGNFYTFVPNDTNERFFSCIVADALACCQQGLEFKTKKSLSWPQDYPKDMEEIIIIGKFVHVKTDDDYDYFYLVCNDIQKA